ncbi:MAG TPA: helix-turn-helix domain-containing protein [Acidimicrobiales bacterium]|nr:helix-turn-helix domain-containing protein [Acidimicrobiales bacterium]
MEPPDHDLRPRRRLTQAEGRAETRRQLLAAAARVFARKGLAGASLEEIAELAGYTTGAVYYHFANKDELFLELIKAGWSTRIAGWNEAVRAVVEEGGADPVDALSRLVGQRADRDHDLEPLQAEFWLYAVRHPEAMAVVAERLEEQVAGIEPAMAALMERCGTGDDLTPHEEAMVALTLFQGLVRRRRIDRAAVSDDLFARVLRRLLAPPVAPTGPAAPPGGPTPPSGRN